MKSTTIGIALLLIGVLLGLAGAQWLPTHSGELQNSMASPSVAALSTVAAPVAPIKKVPVQTALAQKVLLPRGVAAVGSLRSGDSVMLRPEVTGRIAEINFAEGGKVQKGQVLIRLDDSVDRAQWEQAQANLNLANSQYRRAAQLSQQGFISKQARDEAASQLKVQQAAAALAKARLDKTVILAPFDGLIGLRNVSVGDYVSPGSDLAPIESIDPLKVDFRVPEQFLSQVRVGIELELGFDALPGQTRGGRVDAISPLVDVGGRSILLRANVPNADGALRPGMFARVQLKFADEAAVIVPETALVPSSGAQYVFKVVDGRVQRIAVVVGQRNEGQVQIVQGLDDGDEVLISGLQKVADGDAVDILPSGRPLGAS